jgi:hypothetical protein
MISTIFTAMKSEKQFEPGPALDAAPCGFVSSFILHPSSFFS